MGYTLPIFPKRMFLGIEKLMFLEVFHFVIVSNYNPSICFKKEPIVTISELRDRNFKAD